MLEWIVNGRNMARHRHQEFIRFLDALEREFPAGRCGHVILDNSAAQKTPEVRRWLARHPRWTFRFTRTSSSWLNAVEGFFAKLDTRINLPPELSAFLGSAFGPYLSAACT